MKFSYNHMGGALFAGILATTAVKTVDAGPLSVSADLAAQSQYRQEYRYDRSAGAGNGNQTGTAYRYHHRERSRSPGRSTNRGAGSSGWSRQAGGGVSGGARGRR